MTDERLEIVLEPILDTLKIEGIEGNWPKSASLGCFFSFLRCGDSSFRAHRQGYICS